MTPLPLLWAAAAVPTFAATWLALPRPMSAGRRVAIAALCAASVAGAAGGLVEALGQPKPLALELRRPDGDGELVGLHIVPDVEIFVWVLLPGEGAPLALQLPWSSDTAEQLQKAQREAQEAGTGVGIKMPSDAGGTDEPIMPYPMPQIARPEKATS